MYAIGHTSHALIGLSDTAAARVREKFKGFKSKKDRTLFGRCVIKGETWSFFEEYPSAKSFQALLFLHGPAG